MVGRPRKVGDREPNGRIRRKTRMPVIFRADPRSSRNLAGAVHNSESAAVYVIAGAAGTVKIGFSADPAKRASYIQTGNDCEIRLIWSARFRRPQAMALERAIHDFLKTTDAHRRGEWYVLASATAVGIIKSLADKMKLNCIPDIGSREF